MRLIDADKLHDCISDNYSRMVLCTVEDVLKFIEDEPTVEAEPVRHGEWKTIVGENLIGEKKNFLECSICKKSNLTQLGNIGLGITTKYHFCPHCGSQMDGGKGNA